MPWRGKIPETRAKAQAASRNYKANFRKETGQGIGWIHQGQLLGRRKCMETRWRFLRAGGAGGRGVTRAHPLGNLGPPIGVEAITSHEVDKVKDPTVEQGVCHNRIFHSSSLATPRCFYTHRFRDGLGRDGGLGMASPRELFNRSS